MILLYKIIYAYLRGGSIMYNAEIDSYEGIRIRNHSVVARCHFIGMGLNVGEGYDFDAT